jgi:hypothetical protein
MLELRDKVRIKGGGPEIWIIEQIRDNPAQYLIELGSDFATRKWKLEPELELVEKARKTDPGDGGMYPADPIM